MSMKPFDESEYFNRLIILKRLNFISGKEQEDLDKLLCNNSALHRIHDSVMKRRDISEVYSMYRSSVKASEKGRRLFRKCHSFLPQSFPLRRMKAIKYCAASLAPFIILLSYFIASNFLEKKEAAILLPKPFAATIQISENEHVNLAIPASDSYSVSEFKTFSAQKKENSHLYTLSTANDDEFRVILEDGTMIHLNSNSQLYFPKHFGEWQRKIFLKGEAYIQVAKEHRPFIVLTEAGIIRQYGTIFNVRAYEKSRTEIVLIEGSISVERHNPMDEGRSVMMQPGQISNLSHSEGISIKEVDLTPYIAWEKGRFKFEDYPLDNIMKVLKKWYDIDVIYQTSSLKTLRFNGDIDRYGSICPILKAISNVTGANVTLEGRKVIIGKHQ